MHDACVIVSGLFLLTEEEAEALVPAAVDLLDSILGAAARVGIVVEGGLFVHILRYADQGTLLDLLALRIKLAQRSQVVYQLVTQPDTFFGLLEGVFVSVNLGEDGAVLHLELAEHLELPHPVGDAPLLQVELVETYVLQRLLNARCALLQHLHLLIAKSHVMEENEDVELISLANVEVHHIHNPICFLKQIKGFIVLFLFDEGNGVVVELCEDDGDLVLGHSQLLVVMLVEGVVLIESSTPIRLVA